MARAQGSVRRGHVLRSIGRIALAALLFAAAGSEASRAAAEGFGSALPGPSFAGAAADSGSAAAKGFEPALPDSSIASGGDRIERAWREPADSLVLRAERTRGASIESGVWSLDTAARALLVAPGNPVERAEAAVALAPDLPAARMALAHALWRRGDSPLAALREAIAALLALARNLEGALWIAGSALAILAVGLVVGGLACAVSAGVLAAPHAAHDLGDAIGGDAPAFARMALLTALLCAPALLGEGLLGLALGVLALGALYGDARERLALAGAAAAIWLGAFPVAELAGRSLEALARDPVVRAASAVDGGGASAADLAILRAAADPSAASGGVAATAAAPGGARAGDPLAERTLARLARREDRLGEAVARYQGLLESSPLDAALVNDAANVRLRLGHIDAALELYERSLALESSPVVLFNLSQARARAFDVEGIAQALERAQALDGDRVAELTRVQAASESRDFVVDLPLPARLLWSRLARAGDGWAFAAEARAPIAPGRLGREPGVALAGLAAPLVLGSLAGLRIRRSRWCARCGDRSCPRCHGTPSRAELCNACHRLFFQPEHTQRELRVARVAALEERRRRVDRAAAITALLVPGAAGLLASRPVRGLVACVLFAVAATAVAWRDGLVPDPGVAGGAGTAALLLLAAVAAVAYATLVTTSLATRRSA